jgi:hypothetical protein
VVSESGKAVLEAGRGHAFKVTALEILRKGMRRAGDGPSLVLRFFEPAGFAKLGGMNRRDAHHKSGLLAAVILLGLLLAYPLSVGPAAVFIYDAGHTPHWARVTLDAFYWPLRQLPWPFLDRIDDWVNLCGGSVMILQLPPRGRSLE